MLVCEYLNQSTKGRGLLWDNQQIAVCLTSLGLKLMLPESINHDGELLIVIFPTFLGPTSRGASC